MQVQFSKWGNSLGLRIPKHIADEVKATDGAVANIEIIKGNIIISPKNNSYNLDDLLSKISKKNIHNHIEENFLGKEVFE
ncbi:MAG: AbrB/MazE/SpoVT family DNA-binding domain-containing protein [Rickettsiales bacterium]|nr:AbrB/MazE/SpoVT family DNA-binding domain-containing protein [Rickettsiales bacterium]